MSLFIFFHLFQCSSHESLHLSLFNQFQNVFRREVSTLRICARHPVEPFTTQIQIAFRVQYRRIRTLSFGLVMVIIDVLQSNEHSSIIVNLNRMHTLLWAYYVVRGFEATVRTIEPYVVKFPIMSEPVTLPCAPWTA